MNKNLESILESFDDSDLSEWSDLRSISKGRGYVNRVHDIVAIKNGGVTAKVDGTHEYLATIYLNDVNKVEMECSCPVGGGCKHCVALALKCREMLSARKKIKALAEDNSYWRELKSEFGDDMEVFGDDNVPMYEDEKGAIQRIAEMDFSELKALVSDLIKNVGEVLPYLSHKFVMENASAEQVVRNAREAIEDATQNGYNYWEHHRRGYYDDYGEEAPDYSNVQEYFERLAKLGKVKELMKLCNYFVKRCEEQLNMSDDEGEMICGMQSCVEVVAHAVFDSDLPDSEKLLWEYRRQTGDGYLFLESGYDETLTCWKRTDISTKEWSRVADEIVNDCKKSSNEQDHGLFRVWHYLSIALQNSGRGNEAVDIAIATCTSMEGYQRVVEALYAQNRIDEAMEWCRKALSNGKSGDWYLDKFKDWLRRFAAERGDWRVAAAYDVAQFVRNPGCDGFFGLEESCRKAGVWKNVRKILLDCLATGEQPLTRKDWPLPIPEHGEAQISAKQCPMAETLCRIALREERGSDMVKWFYVLVGRKTEPAMLHQMWYNQELAFSVAEAVSNELPDEAIRIWKMIIDANCRSAGENYYETIIRALKAMKPTMVRRTGEKSWRDIIANLREEYGRRRNLVKMLDGLK